MPILAGSTVNVSSVAFIFLICGYVEKIAQSAQARLTPASCSIIIPCMKHTDRLLAEIDAFMVRNPEVTDTSLGVASTNSSQAIFRLRKGFAMGSGRMDRIMEFMRAYEARKTKRASGKRRPSTRPQQAA